MSGQLPSSNFFRMASLVMLLVAVAMLAAITTMHFAIHGAEVQVPALKGMTVAEARSQAAGMGLNLDVDNRYYSGDVAAGTSSPSPPRPARWFAASGACAWLKASARKKSMCPTPSARDERLAALRLRRVGLEVGVHRAPCPTPPSPRAPSLRRTRPPTHKESHSPASISWSPPPDDEAPDGFVMPDLTGLPVVTAQADLAKVGIKSATPAFLDVHVPPGRHRQCTAPAARRARFGHCPGSRPPAPASTRPWK